MFSNIYFYLFAGALFTGLAVGGIVKKRSPAYIIILFSAVTAFLFCGFLFSETDISRIIRPAGYYLFLSLLFFIVSLKPLWAVPPVVIFFFTIFLLYSPRNLDMVSWRNNQQLHIVFFPSAENKILFSVEEKGRKTEIISLEGERLYPVLMKIRFSPFLFFKNSCYVSVIGFSSVPVYPENKETNGADYYSLMSLKRPDLMKLKSLPGITYSFPEQPGLFPADYNAYTLELDNHLELVIEDF